MMLGGLANLLDFALEIYLWIIFISIILSWVPLSPHNPTAQTIMLFLHRATSPVFGFFRRIFRLQRYTSPIDITPMIVILAIHFLRLFAVQTLRNMSPLRNFFLALFSTANFVLTIYFWIVVIAAFFIFMEYFFPYHPIGRMRIPLIANITEPVFDFLRRLFHAGLRVELRDYPDPLDLAPLLVLAALYLIRNLLFRSLAALFFL